MSTEARLSRSKSKCSDEYFDNVCSPCLNKNKHTEGDHYCMECQDYYCSKCVVIHKDFPALSNHTIVENSEFHSKCKEFGASFKHVPTERCHVHKTKLVDMYCTVHKKVGCSACMSLEHMSCQLLYVPDAIRHIMTTCDMSRFTEDCRNLKKAAIERIQVIEEQTNALSINRDYAVKELKEFKNVLRLWLDKIEEDAIKNLENECALLEFKWANEMSKLKKSVNELEHYEAKVKAITNNDSQKFVCVSLGKEIVTATLNQTEEHLQALKSISFAPTLVLKELLTSQTVLGTSSLIFSQERVIRSDNNIHKMTSQEDYSQQRNGPSQQQLIAQLKANEKLPTHGPELAKLMFIGARVVPGKDWVRVVGKFEPVSIHYHFETYLAYQIRSIGTGIGTVVSVTLSTPGNVQVKWDKGDTFEYRMGNRNMYDLKFAE